MKRFLILFLAVFIFACNSKRKESVTGLIADSATVVQAHGLAS